MLCLLVVGVLSMPSFSFEVEYAKSGRAACKKCKGKIDKDLVRVGFKAEVAEDAESAQQHFGCMWYHFACFPQAKGQVWFKKHLTDEVAKTVTGLDVISNDDRAAVAELFKACRGEASCPVAPAPARPEGDDGASPKASKKRKANDDEVKKPAMSAMQIAAIDDAKARLAPKNTAYLQAALAKNGLPKTGRKEELVDRVAENQVLGVPPTCDVCEKKKLGWSRDTGKYSCPGYFDDESKSFKKCKGPSAGFQVKRARWMEPGA